MGGMWSDTKWTAINGMCSFNKEREGERGWYMDGIPLGSLLMDCWKPVSSEPLEQPGRMSSIKLLLRRLCKIKREAPSTSHTDSWENENHSIIF